LGGFNGVNFNSQNFVVFNFDLKNKNNFRMEYNSSRILKIILIGLSLTFTSKIYSQSNPCGSFCVTNIYLDSTNTMMVSIQYTGTNFINYPYVSTVFDNNGVPVGSGSMFYFGQLPNTTQDYPVNTSITPPLPSNFAGVVVFNFDTFTCQLLYPVNCGTNSLTGVMNEKDDIQFYPNPFTDEMKITKSKGLNSEFVLKNFFGEVVLHQNLDDKEITVSCNHMTAGVYFAEVIEHGKTLKRVKVCKVQ
jgi:hypothetical protein